LEKLENHKGVVVKLLLDSGAIDLITNSHLLIWELII